MRLGRLGIRLLTLTPSLPKLLSYFQLDAQQRASDKTHLLTDECVNLVFAEEAKSQSHTSRFSLCFHSSAFCFYITRKMESKAGQKDIACSCFSPTDVASHLLATNSACFPLVVEVWMVPGICGLAPGFSMCCYQRKTIPLQPWNMNTGEVVRDLHPSSTGADGNLSLTGFYLV